MKKYPGMYDERREGEREMDDSHSLGKSEKSSYMGLLLSQSLVATSVGDRTMVQPSPSLLLSSLSSSPHSRLFLLDLRCFVGASLLLLSASAVCFGRCFAALFFPDL
jgi:hypothetical protein